MNKKQKMIYLTMKEAELNHDEKTLNIDLYAGDSKQMDFELVRDFNNLIIETVWVYFENENVLIHLKKRYVETGNETITTIRTTLKDIKNFEVMEYSEGVKINGLEVGF